MLNEKNTLLHSEELTHDLIKEIKADIISKGDKAIKALTKKFDNVQLDDIQVSSSEIQSAYKSVTQDYLTALKEAHTNITEFHTHQKPKSWQKSPREG